MVSALLFHATEAYLLQADVCLDISYLFMRKDGIKKIHKQHNAHAHNSRIPHTFVICGTKRKRKNTWNGRNVATTRRVQTTVRYKCFKEFICTQPIYTHQHKCVAKKPNSLARVYKFATTLSLHVNISLLSN
uniref:Uncharacterized protein n=1 Tax=Ceratitis capitata TaxID=7213 RepID=W8AQE6_CERCA